MQTASLGCMGMFFYSLLLIILIPFIFVLQLMWKVWRQTRQFKSFGSPKKNQARGKGQQTQWTEAEGKKKAEQRKKKERPKEGFGTYRVSKANCTPQGEFGEIYTKKDGEYIDFVEL